MNTLNGEKALSTGNSNSVDTKLASVKDGAAPVSTGTIQTGADSIKYPVNLSTEFVVVTVNGLQISQKQKMRQRNASARTSIGLSGNI